ncbi:hypothetical protein AAF712_003541 [Marasmius tenuissimus]|uniref:Uncharacterized protein n=1 Tax=Marasmius tenuissimus TaxID=585030 RepID=A0ABR3A6H9_9AGAR
MSYLPTPVYPRTRISSASSINTNTTKVPEQVNHQPKEALVILYRPPPRISQVVSSPPLEREGDVFLCFDEGNDSGSTDGIECLTCDGTFVVGDDEVAKEDLFVEFEFASGGHGERYGGDFGVEALRPTRMETEEMEGTLV